MTPEGREEFVLTICLDTLRLLDIITSLFLLPILLSNNKTFNLYKKNTIINNDNIIYKH